MNGRKLNTTIFWSFITLIAGLVNNLILSLEVLGPYVIMLLVCFGALFAFFIRLLSVVGDAYFRCIQKVRGKEKVSHNQF